MLQCHGCVVCRKLGNICGIKDIYAKEELQGVCNGPSSLGKKTQVLPWTTAAFPQAFAVPLPGCCFLTLFNILLHIIERTTGAFEGISQFSQACTVFVLEVKEHPQDRSGSWVGLSVCSQGCLFFLSELPWTGGSLVTVMLCLWICTECYFFNSTSWYAVFYTSIVLSIGHSPFCIKDHYPKVTNVSPLLGTTCGWLTGPAWLWDRQLTWWKDLVTLMLL